MREGGREGAALPWCWVNVEPRAPGGYLSPRGSECSPVGIPPPPLQGEAEGIWIGVPPGPCGTLWGPVGPCGAPSCKDPGELSDGVRGSPVCLFMQLFACEVTFTCLHLFRFRIIKNERGRF